MNWQAIAFDWNQVRAFLAAAEQGSFSSAARVLGLTQPTLGRQVSGFEQALGVTLFERGGRGLALTQAGQDVLDHVRAMGDAASRVSMVASGQSQDLTGEVSVTAVDMVATHYVIPALDQLRKTAPNLSIKLLISNEVQDLTRRDADIAIRHVRPDQPDLYAKLVAEYRAAFFASKSYLDKVGRPDTIQDFSELVIVGMTQSQDLMAMFAQKDVTLRPDQFYHPCNSALVILELMKAGFGASLMPINISRANPGLERVLDPGPVWDFPVWLTTHRELHTSRRIRVVFDQLAQILADPTNAYERSGRL